MYGYIQDFREIGYKKLLEQGLNETQILMYLEETIRALEIYSSNKNILIELCKEKGINIEHIQGEKTLKK